MAHMILHLVIENDDKNMPRLAETMDTWVHGRKYPSGWSTRVQWDFHDHQGVKTLFVSTKVPQRNRHNLFAV